jgi:acetyl-CoA carboxylase carboxyl transferase subunit beta
MDAVVPEPEDGAHTDPAAAAANLRAAIASSLAELLDVPAAELLERRYDRFRAFGAPGRQPVLPAIGGTT